MTATDTDQPCDDTIIERVVSQLRDRSRVGVKKYGVTLGESNEPLSARIEHALQETLDLPNYLTWALDEAQQLEAENERLRGIVLKLTEMLNDKDVQIRNLQRAPSDLV